jgi:glutaredoxin 3
LAQCIYIIGRLDSLAMPNIKIYTTPICPYCYRAKALLKRKGAEFDEIDVFMDADARSEMERKANGRRTVPQIFIGERHVGGCDDLYELEQAGELDTILDAT